MNFDILVICIIIINFERAVLKVLYLHPTNKFKSYNMIFTRGTVLCTTRCLYRPYLNVLFRYIPLYEYGNINFTSKTPSVISVNKLPYIYQYERIVYKHNEQFPRKRCICFPPTTQLMTLNILNKNL